ncbi:SPT2 chromatin protein-domain-containing protein [Gilbertella persicaria]|uniref:SPT2 chromatin protein-domain-containing protein n=1 Tax=Gilbertella persicaria TaxID=101096 RepID=UPI002220F955|nr:SPT2 chromatin protein-domain-containing protein [Gilbertella persicaria]KAI8098050.1 SPT2 chromatin protein-domain-containing protein [Gilbertella persicaria]
MRVIKGDSNMLNFDQLMAQATQVAKQQDASLMERARQKRREDEERRRRELKEQREREEAQAQLAKKRELQEKKQKILLEQKRQEREQEKRRLQNEKLANKSRSLGSNSSKNAFSIKKTSVSTFLPEKKKPVHMSFDDLMKKAKEQSLNKKATDSKPSVTKKSDSISRQVNNNDPHTPSLYHRAKRPESTKINTETNLNLSARERARQMVAEPPKKVNLQKRDRRSISDVQREIRHSKGIHSDDESDRIRKLNRPSQRSPPLPTSRKKPLSPPPRATAGKRPPMDNRRPPSQPPVRRMPFSGRPMDSNARKSIMRRRPREEEEEMDEELAEFIVDDEDEDEGYGYNRNPRRSSYSEEISKIFRYDRNRYANEPVWSDDDMEANASDVLREEKRSERIARREDLIEEQKELERLKKKKKA